MIPVKHSKNKAKLI